MKTASTRRNIPAAAALAALFALVPQGVCAQSWTYSPYNGSSTWLGVSRLINSPLNYYSTPGMPLYMLDPVVRGGTYYAGQGLTNGTRQFNAGNYQADDGSVDPRQRTRPVLRDGNGVTDQVAHAKPYHQDFSGQNKGAPGQGTGYPTPAPGTSLGASHSSPLAAGFVELVNTKYKGDISKALFDPDTRSYARAIGLIDTDEIFDADLNPQKVQTIRSILSDDKEDPSVRISAVRMLLKH